MSLDEVLSSIKKMMIDKEPPVLDLTNIITENGDIVDVQNMATNTSSMGSFLKFVNEDEQTQEMQRASINKKTNETAISVDINKNGFFNDSLKEKINSEAIKEAPLKEESPIIATNSSNESMDKAMLVIIESLMKPMIEKWLKENLPSVVAGIVENEITRLLSKR